MDGAPVAVWFTLAMKLFHISLTLMPFLLLDDETCSICTKTNKEMTKGKQASLTHLLLQSSIQQLVSIIPKVVTVNQGKLWRIKPVKVSDWSIQWFQHVAHSTTSLTAFMCVLSVTLTALRMWSNYDFPRVVQVPQVHKQYIRLNFGRCVIKKRMIYVQLLSMLENLMKTT